MGVVSSEVKEEDISRMNRSSFNQLLRKREQEVEEGTANPLSAIDRARTLLGEDLLRDLLREVALENIRYYYPPTGREGPPIEIRPNIEIRRPNPSSMMDYPR